MENIAMGSFLSFKDNQRPSHPPIAFTSHSTALKTTVWYAGNESSGEAMPRNFPNTRKRTPLASLGCRYQYQVTDGLRFGKLPRFLFDSSCILSSFSSSPIKDWLTDRS